jgi:hypothetical protein
MGGLILDDKLLFINTPHLTMRPAIRDDVPLIFDLRLSKRGKILNFTSPDIKDQYIYFDAYLERYALNKEIYYVISDKKSNSDVGIFRLTKIDDQNSIGWEGLVVHPATPPFFAIEICATVYEIVFALLNRNELGPWKVRAENKVMIKIHDYMNVVTSEPTEENQLVYKITRDNFLNRRNWLHQRGFGLIE